MKLVRPVLLSLAGLAFLAVPADAAPYSTQYQNVVTALESLAESQGDPARQQAVERAVALFANRSRSYAADLGDMANAVRRLEAAFGTDDATLNQLLDGTILGSYVLVFGRAQQAYVGAALKETGRRNYRAIARLARTHTSQINRANRYFPAEAPARPISRAAKLTALARLENYGAALARRYRVTLNQP